MEALEQTKWQLVYARVLVVRGIRWRRPRANLVPIPAPTERGGGAAPNSKRAEKDTLHLGQQRRKERRQGAYMRSVPERVSVTQVNADSECN